MAGVSKKKYIAKNFISFEGLKPLVKVKPGDKIPEHLPEETIKDLLSTGDIEEVK